MKPLARNYENIFKKYKNGDYLVFVKNSLYLIRD